ncbi:MAG: hypothetical protein LBV29_08585 [Azoarcus sp.]|nr:hypothetical protein [Azoarcus sp.]
MITSYPVSEDWGWLLEYIDGDLEVTIGCASMANEEEGYAGKPVSWSIFVRPHKSMKRLFGRRSEVSVPTLLTDTIKSALAARSIEVQHVEA